MSQNTRSKTTPKSSRSTTPTNTNNLTADQTIIDHTSQTTNPTNNTHLPTLFEKTILETPSIDSLADC